MIYRSQTQKPEGAFALVLVLAALVLLLGITVGLLSLAGSERRASSLYSGQSDANRLAERVLDIVRSQINAATTEGEAAEPVSWASQPGMIRTFRGTSEGNVYKLYSWNEMKRPAAGFSGDSIPAGWAAQPAVFTDLNAPVNGVFPIVDPALAANGFSVTGAPGATGAQPCPMPVQWLYVLKDGSLVTGVANGVNANVAGADRGEREIVARVAFWTDDETCKVNINTASEGLHWDAPKAEGGRERDMGRFQPVRHEVQRFPGHPAGVSLSEVFPMSDLELADYSTGQPRVSSDLQERASRAATIAPRVQFGGSLAAYASTSNASTVTDPIVQGASTLAGTRQIDPSGDTDRLYASVSEIVFSESRTVQNAALSLASAAAASEELAQREFVLTTHSVAPETTLFETPKVSLWPIRASADLNAAPSKTNRADAYDKMIALAASLPRTGGGRDKYYFQRENPLSNNELAGISRNKEIFDYLKSLTGKTVPGFSQSLASAWGTANRNSILVQTFDMIRSGVNLTEGGLVAFSTVADQVQSFGYPGSMDGSWNSMGPVPAANANNSIGHVQSTLHDGARGFGTVPFITRLGVGLYCEKLELLDSSGNPASGASVTQIRYTLRPAVLVEAFSPLTPWGPDKQYRIAARVNSVSGLAVSASGSGTGTSGTWGTALSGNVATRGVQSINPAMDVGTRGSGYSPPHLFLVRPTGPGIVSKTEPGLWGGAFTITFPAPANGSFPSSSKNISAILDSIHAGQAEAWGHALEIASGSLDVSLLDSAGNVYQSATVNFDATPALTVPHFGVEAANPGSGANTPRATLMSIVGNHSADYLFENRFKVARTRQDGWVANDGDVVIGKEISAGGRFGGDFRLSALSPSLANADFDYPVGIAAAQTRRHSFARGVDSPISAATGTSGRLLAGQNFPTKVAGGNAQQPTSWRLLRTLSSGVNGVTGAGDYTLDLSAIAMGGLLSAPVEGGVGLPFPAGGTGARKNFRDSYFNQWSSDRAVDAIPAFPNNAQTDLTFSPNRQVISPLQLTGGLMRSAAASISPWETLLFSANPSSTHPGEGTDHLYADLFWMPVVDPYPISEVYSTAGKVNLNSRLEPFGGYLQRETALRAALKAIGIPVVDGSILTTSGGIRKYTFAWPDDNASSQPTWTPNMADVGWTRPLNLDQTLEGIRSHGFFRSATEICNVPLVPDSTTLANYDTFWSDPGRRHTPDNLREQPYAHAYARLTTRSNTYTVHYRVQVLQKVPGTPDNQWIEGRDQVVAEYRGKSLIERYLDPNTTFPDYATEPNAQPMTRFYEWRTLVNTRFSP